MNQAGGSKMDMLVKLVLIFFISLLSFSVGTFVGKQFSDSQHKLASLEGEMSNDRDTASISPEATQVKPEEALTDEDIAHLTEEFVKSEKKGEIQGEAKEVAKNEEHGEHAEHAEKVEKVVGTVSKEAKELPKKAEHGEHKEAAAAHAVSPAAERVAKGETPSEKPKAKEQSRIPSSLPEQVAAQNPPKFFVQIASYKKEDEASKRVDTLKTQGFNAYAVKNQVNGTVVYRVGVGSFATQEEAEKGLSAVKARPGLGDAFIQKIVK